MTYTQIFEDKSFQKSLAELAQQEDTSLEKILKEAEKCLRELYTVHQPIADILMLQGGQYILSRGYDKTIDVNPAEIKQLAKLMHRYPVAFVMTHKTYIDMFVLALVLNRFGLPFPYTFGGINMSFMGLGQFARQTGGIFIRRSFKDNEVYKLTLRHFIATLVKEKSHFMWAIEGTRSRTGKLVWPKMGILKYIAEAEQTSKQEVKYVPVSIVYDLIPDVKEMTQEGRGKDKSPESLWWWINYLRNIKGNFGKISLRLGEPLLANEEYSNPIPGDDAENSSPKANISQFAFEISHRINNITAVTTTSLVCTALLSKFSLSKRALDSDIANLMYLIENHKPDALVDRSKAIGESVQIALNLLVRDKLVQQQGGGGLNAKYTIVAENHLAATYYANMSVHHLYRRAFIELALLKVRNTPATERTFHFWKEIMQLRDLFKFEFFYSDKASFSDKIEEDLAMIDSDWQEMLASEETDIELILRNQGILVAPVVLYTYTEAYRVVAYGLQNMEIDLPFNEDVFVKDCLLLGEELHWQGRIRRIEAVSKPFLLNGVRLADNYQLIPTSAKRKQDAIQNFLDRLTDVVEHISLLQGITLEGSQDPTSLIPLDREMVPGSKTTGLVREILEGEKGKHIAAFFDLDRTLIRGFSAKEFLQARILSGKMTTREVVGQFAGVLVYAAGNGNFAGLAALGAQGVRGIKEQVFIEVGEDVYLKHLADEVYPESRVLVSAHLAQGHSVAIVSAATPYQVNPIARDLGIKDVMCTRMEVEKGTFTGKIIEPACWGDGKAIQATLFADKNDIDLNKSYFYTDSAEDMPLLEIVGKPRPLNPDTKLSVVAFQNNWPVHRFDDEQRPKATNIIRTGLAMGSLFPAVMSGAFSGLYNLSWKDGINSMTATIGDLGAALVGIRLVIKGEENLWKHRPAVFVFNHQSQVDFFIAAKLLRKDILGVAKKELETGLYGFMMKMAGVVFVDRADSEKAIESLKPIVDALQGGMSLAIFPEGTRSYDYKLGRFKKGPFHIAMQAGVPIVPIVIRNAHDVMPRGATFVRPSAVDIVVLPPVSTQNWKIENIDEHVQDIRQLYLDELGQVEEKAP
jgi:putative phosphoserine phosphatase/1-acylglycerol-3-phosphate O-acyltransferase